MTHSQKDGIESDSTRPPFRARILLKLLLLLGFVSVVPLATMSWRLVQTNREELKATQQEYQLLVAKSIANEMDIHVESTRSQLLRVAQTLGSVLRGRSTRHNEIRQALDEVADERIEVLRYSYFRGSKTLTIESGGKDEELEPLFDEVLRHVTELQAQKLERPPAERVVVTEPYVVDRAEGRTVMIIAAPVFSSGSFRGVLQGLVRIDRIWAPLAAAHSQRHLLFALDESGRVFATSDPHRIWLERDVSESPLVQSFLDRIDWVTMHFRDETAPVPEHYLGSFASTGRDWGVFVQVPQERVYEPVQAMIERTWRWALGALALAGLSALVLARQFTRPINRLVGASHAFARGEYHARVEVTSRDEIGELADTFNRMAGEIELQIRRLKESFAENQELFHGVIRALAQAIDAKDPYTRGHSVRVNRYSMILARELGLAEGEMRDLYVASLLHDVGKIGIDDGILKKPGALSDEEFAVMKTHTVLGATIMKPIRPMQRMLPGLRHHHERMNGTGYPDGLEGDEIPMMARIIAVADTFDAITTNRPYQKKFTLDAAVARLNELKGSHLAAPVVEAFNRAMRRGEIRLDEVTTEESPIPQTFATEIVPGTIGESSALPDHST